MFDFFKGFRKLVKGKGAKITQNHELDMAAAQKPATASLALVQDFELSLTPDMEQDFTPDFKEQLKELLGKLPPLKEGNIAVNGVGLSEAGDKIAVSFFIRNGLSTPLEIKLLPFQLVDLAGNVLASAVFDLSGMGKIPPRSARPWEVEFVKGEIDPAELLDNWDIGFALEAVDARRIRYRFDNLSDKLSDLQRTYLEQFLLILPPVPSGQLHFAPFKAERTDEGGLLASVVVRNASLNTYTIDQVRLAVQDARQREVAVGTFKISDSTVGPYGALLWTVNFPPETLLEQDIDLSNWAIYPKGAAQV